MRPRVKPVFHFNRIVAKRSVFLCFLSTRVELMTSTQKKMLRYVTLRYVTLRLKWKTGLKFSFNFTHVFKVSQIALVVRDSGKL